MIIIGMVLLIAAGAFGLDLVAKNRYTIRSPVVFGQTLGIHSAAVFFVAGAVTGAVLLLAIALILAGLRRRGTKARQRRHDRKEARNAGRDRDQAQQENEKLREQLDQDRNDDDTRTSSGSSGGATATDGA